MEWRAYKQRHNYFFLNYTACIFCKIVGNIEGIDPMVDRLFHDELFLEYGETIEASF